MTDDDLSGLFQKNRAWVAQAKEEDPEFFYRLSAPQTPKYLWIGCSDSRVPANQIMGTSPGEVFVHRNIANVVANADSNALSVLQYAVEVLHVEHILVVGHYSCGGVAAAMSTKEHGLIDQWLRNIKDVYLANQVEIDGIEDLHARQDRLSELNVMAQARHVASTTIVQNAWAEGRPLKVHGLIFSLEDGLLRSLGEPYASSAQLPEVFRLRAS